MNRKTNHILPICTTLSGFCLILAAFLVGIPTVKVTQVQAQACPVPDAVTGVKVAYPLITGSQASFTQAGCTWSAVASASSYTVTVTQTDTNTVVMSQSEPAGTLNVAFQVTQGDTYKCDVAAVNSCGNTGAAGSDTALCPAQGLVSTPSATPVPQKTLPKTGSVEQTMVLTLSGLGLLLFGATSYFVTKRNE